MAPRPRTMNVRMRSHLRARPDWSCFERRELRGDSCSRAARPLVRGGGPAPCRRPHERLCRAHHQVRGPDRRRAHLHALQRREPRAGGPRSDHGGLEEPLLYRRGVRQPLHWGLPGDPLQEDHRQALDSRGAARRHQARRARRLRLPRAGRARRPARALAWRPDSG